MKTQLVVMVVLVVKLVGAGRVNGYAALSDLDKTFDLSDSPLLIRHFYVSIPTLFLERRHFRGLGVI